jgi:hypothetical protein
MAIVRVGELGEARTGNFSESGVRQYTRSFVVVTDDHEDGPLTVKQATDPNTGVRIPLINEIYVAGNDTDTGARVVSIVPKQIDGEAGKAWHVQVDYDSEFADSPEDPLAAPVEISSTFQQFTRTAFYDINGSAIANAAGHYFDPSVEIDDSRPCVVMVKNQSSFNFALAMDFQDAVNNAAWWLFPTRSVKVANISAKSAPDGGTQYVQVTYEFHIRRDLWIPLKILNAGRVDINGNDRVSGRPVTDPWPLYGTVSGSTNTAGTFLPVGFSLSSVNFKEFTVYKERDFTQLGVP